MQGRPGLGNCDTHIGSLIFIVHLIKVVALVEFLRGFLELAVSLFKVSAIDIHTGMSDTQS